MMKFKRLLALVACAVMVISLSACSSSKTTYDADDTPLADVTGSDSTPDLSEVTFEELDGLVIGMAFRHGSNDTYMTTYFQHLKNYAAEVGVELILLDAVDDATKQMNQVEDLIAMNVDVLMIWPVNSACSVASAKLCYDAGIKALFCNSNCAESGKEYTVGFAGPDDYTEGYKCGVLAMEALGDDAEGAQVLFVEGVSGQQQAIDRRDGFCDAVEEYGGVIVDSQSSEGTREKATQVVENWLIKYGEGEIDIIAAFDDNTAVGIYNAAVEKGRFGEFAIYGVATGDYEIISNYIKTGLLNGAALQSPITESETDFQWALYIALGGEIPVNEEGLHEVYIDTPIITPENFDEVDQGNFEELI